MEDMMSTLNIGIRYNGQECILHNITERGIAILRNFRAPGAMYHSPTIEEIIKQNKENEALKDAYIAYKSNKAQANAEYEKLKYQLDTYSNKNNYQNNDIFLGVSSILFPFVDLLRK